MLTEADFTRYHKQTFLRLTAAAQLLTWPLLIAVCVFGIIWADQHADRDPARGLMALAVIIVVSVVEQWLTLDKAQHPRLDRQLLHDLGHFTMNVLTGAVTVWAPLLLLWGVIALLPQAAGGLIWPAAWPWLAQCLLALIIADFIGYWWHRAEHRVPALWAYHILHHDLLDRLHIIRGVREHFLTNIFRGMVIYGPIILLGAPIEALFAYQTLAITQGSIAHGNLKLTIPHWVHRLLLTPQVHRIHHARDVVLSHSNFSTITPIWDQLFGTYTDPTKTASPAIGVDGEHVPDNFLGQLGYPFKRWLNICLGNKRR